MNEYIGVEIGGTKQQVASYDENGSLIRVISEKIKLVRGADDIRDWLKIKIPELITPNTKKIGVGFGGIVDTRTGVTDCSVHVPGWENYPLKDWMEKNFNLPSIVINDTVCGGYAEVLFGEGKDVDYFFYTNIGTGIGGAYFVKGKNLNGRGMGAAYMGQQFVPSWSGTDDEIIRMEKICSGVTIEQRIRQKGYIPSTSMLYKMCEGNTEKASCTMLCEAARQGDKFACDELDRWAQRYSIALANFLALLSPQKIAIGGGFSNNGDIVFSRIRREVKKLEFCSVKGNYEIVQCKTKDEAVLIGAAMYARDGFNTI